MTNKTKAEHNCVYKIPFWFAVFTIFICGVFIGVFISVNNNLESQLAECQEGMDIWQVKTYCRNEISHKGITMDVLSTANFTNYTFYKEFLKHYEDKLPDYCEVLP